MDGPIANKTFVEEGRFGCLKCGYKTQQCHTVETAWDLYRLHLIYFCPSVPIDKRETSMIHYKSNLRLTREERIMHKTGVLTNDSLFV